MNPGLWGLIAQMAPNDSIREKAGMLSLLGSGSPSIGATNMNHEGVAGSNQWEDKAYQMATNRYGYSPEDWNKLDSIITQESHWDPTAVNPSSGAAGIPQRIAGFKPGWQEDPMKQIRWLLNYVQNHNYTGYGSGIDAAYQHKQDTGWY